MTSELRPYPEYKDSGVPWLGRIPAHWDIRRTKYLAMEMDKRSADENGNLLSVSQYTGVTKRRSREGSDDPDTRASSLIGYKVATAGDLVVNIMLAWNGSLGVSPIDGVVSPAYCVYRINGGNPWFFHHLLRSPAYKAEIKRRSRGVVESRLRLYTDDLFRMPLLVPSAAEQQSIVSFVRDLDIRGNRFIRNRRRLIEVLNEQKQAIINRAVTRGLNPNARLKPSGIDWLGDIPAHWDLLRNKQLFRERIDPGDPDLPLLVVSLRTGVTVGEEVDERGRPKRLIEDRTKYRRACVGDIAYNMMRFWQGAVGAVPVDGLVSPAYVVAEPRVSISSRYFEFLFRTTGYMAAVNRESRGIVADRNRTYWDDFKQILSPVPPVREQYQIVEAIDDETHSLLKAICTAEREIELVQEYRRCLVADVVTGKVDVRGLASAEPLPADEPSDEGFDDEEMLGDDEPELVEEAVDADG